MAINLIAKLKDIKMTEFKWSNFQKKVTTNEDGTLMEYILFELTEPKETVTGSQRVFSPTDRTKSAFLTAYDVTEVEVELAVIEEFVDDFAFDYTGTGDTAVLTGSGSYAGNLRLDVSRNDRVWLVKESLAKKSNDWKNGKSNARIDELVRKAEERAKAKQDSAS